MSQGFAPPLAQPTNRPKTLEAIALSQSLKDCFASIQDPRVERTRLHQLGDILTIAILAVLAGGNGWEDMEVYGLSKQEWLSTFLALPNGIPSADTFRRLFERLNPKQFEQCFEQWVKQLVQDLGIQVIAIDGKNLKGSYDRESGTLPRPSASRTEAGHHRTEIRQVWSIPLDQLPPLYQAEEWVGLQTIVIVERTRHLWNETTHEIQFYLSSLPDSSPRIAPAIRQHWGIENSLHWTLDVTFGEDACRVRSLHAPHNLGLVRRFALNTLNRESTFKRSLRQKSKRAAMDNDYMLTLLAAALPTPTQELQPSCQ